MTRAYNEQYLSDAMNNLGEMMDYAVNTCHFEINEFFDMFLVSDLAVQFARGVPKVVSGMSGVELAMEVVRKSGSDMELPDAEAEYDRSPEYWCGWIAAFYQWYTGVSFREISQIVSMTEIRKMYPTLHEASELKFVDTVNAIARRKKSPTKLRMFAKGVRILAKGTGRKVGSKSQDASGV
ncbi:MAG: XRE family transcriptional regulator [Lachnospiraceae bacterium]